MTATRSGWLTYAAVMMFVAAGFSAIWAINLWSDAAWVANVSNGVLGDKHWLWGFVDAGLVVLPPGPHEEALRRACGRR